MTRIAIAATAAFALLAGAGQALATYAVGDRVWNDVNNNGIFDTGESGIGGVVIGLYGDVNNNCVADGAAFRTVTTNSSGSYLFTGIGNSQYVIQLESSNFNGTGVLVGYTSSTGAAGATSGPYEPGLRESNLAADNNKDHGTLYGSGTTTQIRACGVVITGGFEPVGEGNQPPGIVNPDTDPNTNATVDFGVFKPSVLGALGDRVWNDLDHDGVQDAGEPGVAGVTVRLLNLAGTTVLSTQTTNASGNYLFSGLVPGNYMIEVVPPAGAQLTVEDVGDNTLDSDPNVGTLRTTEGFVTGGQTNTAIDAGLWYPMTLGNLVWRDNNNSGSVDAGEPGIANVVVQLLNSAGTVVATTNTDANGGYTFTNLIAGDYRVQIPAAEFGAGRPLAGLSTSTGGGSEPAQDPDVNAADNDDNGSASAGNVVTLPVTLSPNTEPTTDGDGANGNLTVDLGFAPPLPGALGDRLWLDQNANGAQDAGEPGIAGATVRLYDATGASLLATTTTDANGNYLFSGRAAGTYVVEFVAPAGAQFTTPNAVADQALDSDAAVANGRTSEGVVLAGQTNTQIDAGVYYPVNLGNQVWRDLNNNGAIDAGEPGIAGVTVELLNSAGTVVATTSTSGAAGTYNFTGLVPGDYSVRLAAANFLAGGALVGLRSSTGNDPVPDPDNNLDGDDNGPTSVGAITSAPITLSSAAEPTTDGDGNNGNLTVDFGLFAPATLGDRVWLDQNGNGVQDAGEPGVAGVTVSLCNSAGTVISTTTTGADGSYQFAGVAPGNVFVGFTNPPAGAVLSPANLGGSDAADSDATAFTTCNVPVTVVSGDVNTTIDAGLYVPLNLGNLVWRDADDDGLFDAGEAPIVGVSVQLLNAAGTQIAQTTTNASGIYAFSGLAPGAYSVRIPATNFAALAPLAGLVSSTGNDPAPDPDNDTDGDDNGSASGGDVVSQQITLVSGGEPTADGDGANGNLTVDFGFASPATAAIGDRVWLDQNGNGLQDAGEPGVAGASVALCTTAGTVITTTTTAADGSYLFPNLPAGNYRVGFTAIPAGTQLTSANQGTDDTLDSDATAIAACSDPSAIAVSLAVGQINRSVDAGVYFPLTLGNLVWRDVNNSGAVDAGEPGIAGVSVELLNAAGTVVGTTNTNGTGIYTFTGLAPGDYRVRIPALNLAAGGQLAGLVSSSGGGSEPAVDPDNNTDNDDNGTLIAGVVESAPVTLASTTEPTVDGDGANGNLTVDFGFTPTPASVGDRVWLDQNGNGLQDAGEPGAAGVTVSLCSSAAPQVVVATATTDANGNYTFANLVPGSYLIGFTNLPAGSQLTAANQGANDAIDSDAVAVGPCTVPVTLAPGQANTTIDAGVYLPLTLGNLVWRDTDNDGLVDAGEPGVAGVTVELLDAAGVPVGVTTTSGTGTYQFTGLAPGVYSVRIPQANFAAALAGLVSSTGNDPAPDPDNNTDNDDNGPTAVGGAVTSLPITLASNTEPTSDGFGANVNTTVDFGFTPLASLGDRVWEDVNHNGIQDAGEPGLAGVPVNLCTAGPTPTVIATVTTDATGAYSFTGLVPGAYQVGLPVLPVGSALTSANQGANDGLDSDLALVGPCTLPVTLAPGQNQNTIDVGVWFPLNLGDLVWRDDNNNGVVDAGEPGISGVSVELLVGGAVTATATTNASGIYTFPNLTAGDYVVRIAAANFTGVGPLVNATSSSGGGSEPAPDPDVDPDNGDDNGTTSGGAVSSALTTLARGSEPTTDGDGANGNLTVDFGFVPPPSLGDRVWEDTNHNGIQDPGEPGLQGVTVSLCNAQGTVVATATTSATGSYLFTNLAPGTYQVGFTALPAGGQLTTANQGSDATDSDASAIASCNVPVTLAPGEVNTSVDAGVWFPLALGNRVFRDLDNDGLLDAGETGVGGVTVQLLDASSAVVATTTTDPNGVYLFDGLLGGDYSVRIPASNFVAAGALSGFTGSTGNDPAPDPDNNTDNDDNGPTAAAGAITSAPVTLLRNTEPTNDGDGANGNLTVDFGVVPLGSIGDHVWDDTNHNGVQDPGEPGVGGVTVTLCTSTGTVVATTTTDTLGNYVFPGLLPGAYQVGVATLPAGAALTLANQGANDGTDSDATALGTCTVPVTLAGGQNTTTVDIGLWFPLSLGNLVWSDVNNNGRVDAGEPGIPGVTVELLTTDGTVVATTTTGGAGTYLFSGLTPGEYVVRIPGSNFTGVGALVNATSSNGGGSETAPDPDNDFDGDDNGTIGGGAVASAPVTLEPGTEPAGDGDGTNGNLTVDFGFLPPPSVGDRVWNDLDHDGIQDPGEPGLAGVTVTLCNPQGTVIASTTTSATGAYLFANLAPGSYQVGFTNLPAGAQLTLANQGPSDAADSDATAVAQCNVPVTLAPGEQNTSVDAGVWTPLTLGNRVFRDLDNNGAADATDPGIANVTVELLDANGVQVATTTTNAQGVYTFTGLIPGDYAVRVPASEFGATGDLNGLASSTGGASEPAPDPDADVDDNDDNGSASAGAVVTEPISLAPGTEPTNDGDGANGNLTLDLGFYLPDASKAELGDFVWNDQNANGVQDAGEPGRPGITVTLYDGAGAVVATTTTGANGAYRFPGLTPGTYSVGFSGLPVDSTISAVNQGANPALDSDADPTTGRTAPVTLAAGEINNTVDAGIWSLVRLGNLVWIDGNNNGVVDAGEPGVPGVTMELLDPVTGAVLATTTTDADGHYLFGGLRPGDYQVQVPPSNFAPGRPLAGFVTSTGANASPVGSVEPGADPNNDTDNDDNGTSIPDPAIPSPTIPPPGDGGGGTGDGNGDDNSDNTDHGNNGIGIGVGGTPGPGGQRLGAGRAAGTPGALVSAPVTVTSGGEPTTDGDDANGNLTVDFGVFNTGSIIGDRIWNDQNQNGIQDPGEPGVGNVTVTLSSGGVPVATAVTPANGIYVFVNVLPGTYTVTFSNLPTGATFSPANQGPNDALDSDVNPATGTTGPITVTANTENRTIDAGVILLSALGDAVWNDLNKNGLHDANEPGVPGVVVTLFDVNGTQVGQTTTDASGVYGFQNLVAGTYSVGFSNLPAGTGFVSANVGGDDAIDSDVDPTSGRTPPVVLLAGQKLVTVDAGIAGVIVIIGTPQPTTLTIRKRASKPVIKINTNVVFTITVRNTGAVAAQNVKVCDRIPPRMRFVSGRGSRLEGGRRCWTIRSLGVGQSAVFKLTLRAVRLGNTTNVATAAADNAPQVTGRAAVRILLNPRGGRTPIVTGELPRP